MPLMFWIPVLVLIVGAICFFGIGHRRLFYEEKPKGNTPEDIKEKEARERVGQDMLSRLIWGNPTRGPIKISQFSLWILLFFLSVILTLWVSGNKVHAGIATILLVAFIVSGIKEIPARPPHRGVYAFLRKRTYSEMDEGYVFLAPVFESAYTVNITKRDYDVIPRNVRTMDNAELSMRVAIAWRPDPDRLTTFLEVGETQIVSLLDSLTQEEIRKFFYQEPKYEEGKRRTEEYRDVDGKFQLVISDEQKYLMQPWEKALGMQKDASNRLLKRLTGAEPGEGDLKSGDGFPDHQGWGIRIMMAYIGPIRLTGQTEIAAERRAEEVAQRRAEVFEKETESQQALVLVGMAKEAGHAINYETALKYVLDYKATMAERGFAIPGIQQVAEAILRTLRRGGE